MAVAMLMAVMHEHMHERAGEQQKVGEDAKHVHRVFVDEEERRNHAKAYEHGSPCRREVPTRISHEVRLSVFDLIGPTF
jgi:hypothetical protein